MELNKVHHRDFLENELPENCAALIIADPPYYKVKGEFDFIWPSFEAYLKDVEAWAKECKRLLKDNGSLIWYGSANRIAYAQIILDKYFYLLNNGVVHVTDRQTNKNKAEEARKFINTTERFLLYSGEKDNANAYLEDIRAYLRDEIKKAKGNIVYKDINEVLGTATNGGGVASACLSLNKAEPIMLSRPLYAKLKQWCAPHLSKTYDELNADFVRYRDELRRAFNPIEKYKMEVLRISQESHLTRKYDHETVKPETLTRIFINTCSRPGDLIVVPFAGSGTECSMAVKESREFVAFEIEAKHVKTSEKRILTSTSKPALF